MMSFPFKTARKSLALLHFSFLQFENSNVVPCCITEESMLSYMFYLFNRSPINISVESYRTSYLCQMNSQR